MRRAFTLLELIVVIVILGILATLGFGQYTKTVEKMRTAEPKTIVSAVRKLAVQYYLENGTTSGISNSTLGIGTDIPSSCDSNHYFSYGNVELSAPSWVGIYPITRCTSGGKPPNASNSPYQTLEWQLNLQTGQEVFCYPSCGWGNPGGSASW